jgi:hypothetical protein
VDLNLTADLLDPPKTGLSAYYNDPAGFVQDCIIWPPGQGPTDYQLENLDALVKYGSLAERGPHGLGKTAKNAWVVLWFALTRDAAMKDWKAATTASAWRQLEKYLWPEIRQKWAKRLDWAKIGRPPFIANVEMLNMELRLAHGIAFAAACEDPAKIEGLHADEVLYVYDEAKTIPDATFDATEGALMGAGEDTAMNAFRIASSTPGEPVGRFFDIHSRKKGLEDWHAVHVTLEDTIKAKRVSARKAEQLKHQWGEDSALYINRVLGNFASREEDGVIPLRWVEEANLRWEELNAAGWVDLEPLHAVGVDVATSGKDKTVYAHRHGMVIHKLERRSKQDAMETAGEVMTILRTAEHHPVAMVDQADAGVIARLREQGANVKAFVSSHHDDTLKDITGELEMLNLRAAAWWHLRDLLNPENGKDVALPPDDKLLGDLVTPRYKEHSSGRVKVELKEEIRKRLGRSPDDGDAVVYAFWTAGTTTIAAPIFTTRPSRYDVTPSPYGALRQRAR